VGDKIRSIFSAGTVLISIYDYEQGIAHRPYLYEGGQRIEIPSCPIPDDPNHVEKDSKPVRYDTIKELEAAGITHIEGTAMVESYIAAPLLAGDKYLGLVSLQDERPYAFTDADLRLLCTLANSMSIALENARLFDETQHLLQETQQRNAELAVINSVQKALATQVDIQDIYDLVGERIRETFSAQGVMIVIINHEQKVVQTPYLFEKGKRYYFDDRPLSDRFHKFSEAKQPLLFSTTEEWKAGGLRHLEGTEVMQSYLGVPLMLGNRNIGGISLQDEKPHAFDEDDMRLLTTLAHSVSVSLENARLFNETQNLLQQTQQRNAELAVINSVQQGLAAQLDMNAIYDLVGDRIRDIFDAQAVMIGTYDHDQERAFIPYLFEKGERYTFTQTEPFNKFSRYLIDNRQTVLINENAQEKAVEFDMGIPAGEHPQSMLFVPLATSDKVIGFISLQDIDHEHAFDKSDVRLLETLAASMSVALENARLFAESQRLLHETEQRAAELTIINSVGQALASQLDYQAIIEMVGERIRETFAADSIALFQYDCRNNLLRTSYWIQDDHRFPVHVTEPEPSLTLQIIEKSKPIIIGTYKEAVESGSMFVQKDPDDPHERATESFLGVPILIGNEVTGVIHIQSYEQNAYDESHMRLLSTIASNTGIALENARLFAEIKRRAKEMSALAAVGQDITATLDLPTVLERITRHARELLDVGDSAVFLPDAGGQIMKGFVALGSIATQVKASTVQPGVGILGDIWQQAVAEVINDASNDPRAITIAGTEVQVDEKMMVAPLLTGDQVSGLMAVWRTGGEPFGEADLSFLVGLARQAAIAIENARLFSEAEAARATAEEANESKSVFLANVSHELRTPLTSILGFARIVQKRLETRILPRVPADEPRTQRAINQVEKNLNIILAEGERLTALINNVLDLEKIEAGQMDWQMESLSIVEVIEQGINASAAIVEQQGLTLQVDIADKLPPISGDHDKLVQVIINLLSNAAKFTTTGAITCRAEAINGRMQVSVQDTGSGIAEADLPYVFEKFRQVGDTLTDKPKGTGLGLSICKEIVTYHGGDIWVESRLGAGSTFFFTLPIAPETAEPGVKTVAIDDLLTKLKQRIAAVPAQSDNGDKTLLVADDDPHIRELLRQELTAEGYQVFEAKDGREALEQVKTIHPDLVILDILMPELSGFDVAAVIKNDPRTMGLPIVVISVLEDKKRGFRLGVDRYLTKPINVQTLLHEVQALLDQGLSRRKVLVIDEDADTVQTLSSALKAQGYEVTAVTNGAEGINMATTDHPDMIIVNALLSEQLNLVQAIRFEKGLENVLFLLFQ
jgi:K+-sensing histidine kinase KdpD/DNA-binding response OmpR family regulator